MALLLIPLEAHDAHVRLHHELGNRVNGVFGISLTKDLSVTLPSIIPRVRPGYGKTLPVLPRVSQCGEVHV